MYRDQANFMPTSVFRSFGALLDASAILPTAYAVVLLFWTPLPRPQERSERCASFGEYLPLHVKS